MSTLSVARRGRLLLASVAVVVALAVPTAALADTTPAPTIYPAASNHATIRLTGGSVIGRVVVNTQVSFTCDPFLVFDWETGSEVEVTTGSLEYGAVTIVQASGRTINSGEGTFFGGDVVCDGTTVNLRDVAVVAGLAPWKAGMAVAGAHISISSPDFNSSSYASTGAMSLKLGR
ncbi:MAG TPA: hypothetical protein VHM48_02640 [Candidatus Limnocylindrales bacterium]|nr:hypothetical protein [Candidatus Limnocylindrales bacterium]